MNVSFIVALYWGCFTSSSSWCCITKSSQPLSSMRGISISSCCCYYYCYCCYLQSTTESTFCLFVYWGRMNSFSYSPRSSSSGHFLLVPAMLIISSGPTSGIVERDSESALVASNFLVRVCVGTLMALLHWVWPGLERQTLQTVLVSPLGNESTRFYFPHYAHW